MELIVTIALMENIFNVKYLENGKRYDVGLTGRQIGNHQWAKTAIFVFFGILFFGNKGLHTFGFI